MGEVVFAFMEQFHPARPGGACYRDRRRNTGGVRYAQPSCAPSRGPRGRSGVHLREFSRRRSKRDDAHRGRPCGFVHSELTGGKRSSRRGEQTECRPDSAPAWWGRMVAADAASSSSDAVGLARAAHRWNSKASSRWLVGLLLLERYGDVAAGRDALRNALTAPPLDPVVELNASIIQLAAEDQEDAVASIRRLLTLQPDISKISCEWTPGASATPSTP